MDLNLIVICGRIAGTPEVRTFDSGTRLIRYLVTTRVTHPRPRVDVVPVTLWDPDDDLAAAPGERGQRIWVCGSVQRRYWDSFDGRRNRLEVIAEQVNLKETETDELMEAKA